MTRVMNRGYVVTFSAWDVADALDMLDAFYDDMGDRLEFYVHSMVAGNGTIQKELMVYLYFKNPRLLSSVSRCMGDGNVRPAEFGDLDVLKILKGDDRVVKAVRCLDRHLQGRKGSAGRRENDAVEALSALKS